jgi:membrane protein YdbS with pleckstrin-like domain
VEFGLRNKISRHDLGRMLLWAIDDNSIYMKTLVMWLYSISEGNIVGFCHEYSLFRSETTMIILLYICLLFIWRKIYRLKDLVFAEKLKDIHGREVYLWKNRMK